MKCQNCNCEITKKPIKTISEFSLNSDRFKLVKRENEFTTTQFFCSLQCRDSCNGNWVDCINPPKNALQIEDDYLDEIEGQFYCPVCNKRTSKKTPRTSCIKCNTPLNRLKVD